MCRHAKYKGNHCHCVDIICIIIYYNLWTIFNFICVSWRKEQACVFVGNCGTNMIVFNCFFYYIDISIYWYFFHVFYVWFWKFDINLSFYFKYHSQIFFIINKKIKIQLRTSKHLSICMRFYTNIAYFVWFCIPERHCLTLPYYLSSVSYIYQIKLRLTQLRHRICLGDLYYFRIN